MTDQQPEIEEEFITSDAISTVSTTFYPEDCSELETVSRLAGETPFVFLEFVQEDGAIGAEITASWVEDYDTLIELLETFADVLRRSQAVQELTATEQSAEEIDADEIDVLRRALEEHEESTADPDEHA